MPDVLSPKYQAFVDWYIQGVPGSEAYRRAGFAVTTDLTARTGASKLLADPDVRDAIRRKQRALGATAMVRASELLAEIDDLALSDVSDVLDFAGEQPRLRAACEIPSRARRAIASIKVKRVVEKKPDGKGFLDVEECEIIEFKFWDKPAALRMALQRRGLLEPLAGEKEERPCKVYLNFDPETVLGPAKASETVYLAAPSPPSEEPIDPSEAPPS